MARPEGENLIPIPKSLNSCNIPTLILFHLSVLAFPQKKNIFHFEESLLYGYGRLGKGCIDMAHIRRVKMMKFFSWNVQKFWLFSA